MGFIRTCAIPKGKRKRVCYKNFKGTRVCRPVCTKYKVHK